MSSLIFYHTQVVLLDAMRKEVLKLEDKLENAHIDMAKTKSTLDVTRKEHKVIAMPVFLVRKDEIS